LDAELLRGVVDDRLALLARRELRGRNRATGRNGHEKGCSPGDEFVSSAHRFQRSSPS
jgi:hypothetical protein